MHTYLNGNQGTETVFLLHEQTQDERAELVRSYRPIERSDGKWIATKFEWKNDHAGPIVEITWKRN